MQVFDDSFLAESGWIYLYNVFINIYIHKYALIIYCVHSMSHFEGRTLADIVRKETAEGDIWTNGGGTDRRT